MQIKDIARLAGVSPSTVSRVLNNSGYVSEEIRLKVQSVIDETGYRPNQIAKSLKDRSTKTIGIIIPQIASETMAKLVEAAYRCCNERGYKILMENTQLDWGREIESLKSLYHQQVEGILLMSVGLSQEHKQVIDSLKIPVIVTGQKMDGLCCYTHDNRNAVKALVTKMIERGKKRIAILNVDIEEDDSIRVQRELGYRDALSENGIEFDPKLAAYGKFSVASGMEMMGKIWNENEVKPDGVFAVTDKIAIGAMRFLMKQKVDIPVECAVAGVGNNKLSEFIEPALSTIEYHYTELGTAATNLLIDAIEGNEKAEGIHLMKYDIIERSSTNEQYSCDG